MLDKRNCFHYTSFLLGESTRVEINTKNLLTDSRELKQVFFEDTPEQKHFLTEYPNGVLLEIKFTPEITEIWCSHRLVLNAALQIVVDEKYPYSLFIELHGE